MNERSVRGIHQPDDAVIDAAGQIGGQVGEFVFVAECWNARAGLRRGSARCVESRSCGRRLRNEDPDEAVMLFAGVAAGVDAIDFEFLIGGERRNQLALAGVRVEAPAVVAAFDLIAVETSAGERHAAVRAGVLQCETTVLSVAPDDQRRLQQRRPFQAFAKDCVAGQGAIPETGQHQRIWRFRLRGIVEHGNEARVLQSGKHGNQRPATSPLHLHPRM